PRSCRRRAAPDSGPAGRKDGVLREAPAGGPVRRGVLVPAYRPPDEQRGCHLMCRRNLSQFGVDRGLDRPIGWPVGPNDWLVKSPPMAVERRTVDLSAYPDLVVIYLGMRMNALAGLKTIIGFGPGIQGVAKAKPDGLLLHEDFIMSLFPVHAGMRQYWRDWDSLEKWARSEPHRQ